VRGKATRVIARLLAKAWFPRDTRFQNPLRSRKTTREKTTRDTPFSESSYAPLAHLLSDGALVGGDCGRRDLRPQPTDSGRITRHVPLRVALCASSFPSGENALGLPRDSRTRTRSSSSLRGCFDSRQSEAAFVVGGLGALAVGRRRASACRLRRDLLSLGGGGALNLLGLVLEHQAFEYADGDQAILIVELPNRFEL